MCLLGTFAEHTVVNQASCVKIEDDLPLDVACLLGCGVITGWGSVVYAGEARARRRRRGRRRRRHRHQRGAGRVALGAEHDRGRRPGRVQAGARPWSSAPRHAVASSQEAAALLTELTRGRMATGDA